MTAEEIEEKLHQEYTEIEAEKRRIGEETKYEYKALLKEGDMDGTSEPEQSRVDVNIEDIGSDDIWNVELDKDDSEESDSSDSNFESERDIVSDDEGVDKEKMTESFLQIQKYRTKEIGAQIRMIERLGKVEMEHQNKESGSEVSKEFKGFEEPCKS